MNLRNAYGMLRGYLGERNRDQSRMLSRQSIVRTITTIRRYRRSKRIWPSALILIGASSQVLNSGVARRNGCARACLILVLLIVYYARMCRQLTEYDIDGFL